MSFVKIVIIFWKIHNKTSGNIDNLAKYIYDITVPSVWAHREREILELAYKEREYNNGGYTITRKKMRRLIVFLSPRRRNFSIGFLFSLSLSLSGCKREQASSLPFHFYPRKSRWSSLLSAIFRPRAWCAFFFARAKLPLSTRTRAYIHIYTS